MNGIIALIRETPENPPTLLMGMEIAAASVENRMEVP